MTRTGAEAKRQTALRVTSAILDVLFEVKKGPFGDHARLSVGLCQRLNPVSICIQFGTGHLLESFFLVNVSFLNRISDSRILPEGMN
jgi:hypothetical protein